MTPEPDLTERTRALIGAFADRFYRQKDVRGAFEEFVAPDYIQHNPGIPDGREAAVARLLPMFSNPATSFEVKRVLVDGEFACLHLHARPGPGERGGAVCDLYRVRDGKIVEHWDVMQPVPAESANRNTMF